MGGPALLEYGKLDVEPLQITLRCPGQLVSKKQYPLSKEEKKGLPPIAEIKAGLLKLCMSPCSTPILPVMVQDLRVGF